MKETLLFITAWVLMTVLSGPVWIYAPAFGFGCAIGAIGYVLASLVVDIFTARKRDRELYEVMNRRRTAGR